MKEPQTPAMWAVKRRIEWAEENLTSLQSRTPSTFLRGEAGKKKEILQAQSELAQLRAAFSKDKAC